MATYYVRPDGNDGNTGLGPTAGQAWQTIQKALGASGIGSGDTLYIAPGLYVEQITIGGTYSATTYITGDPTASQFSGVSAGRVQIGAFSTLGAAPLYTGNTISGTSKNNLYFSNIEFLLSCGSNFANAGVAFSTSVNLTFDKCVFQGHNTGGYHLLNVSPPTSTALNLTVKNCVFSSYALNAAYQIVLFGQSASVDTSSITNTVFMNGHTGIYSSNVTLSVTNCTFLSLGGTGILQLGTPVLTLRNSLFHLCGFGAQFTSSVSGTQTFCRYVTCGTSFTNAPSSATSSVVGTGGFDNLYSLLVGSNPLQPFSSYLGSPNTGFGTSTGAPATDMYGVTWTGATPDAGSATYRTIGGVGTYLPSERNASAITIAPGSTSQSIELYLGATGLAFNTSGLQAYYIRNRSAPVAITLVTQTATGAWTSGGFAEISSSLTPGVYRLDVPDAALAAGADDVTIVVRGASGTNGAVMTVKLSSGGLTSAQTASAVWDAARASYATAGSFGEYVNTNINTGAIADAVWDEARSGHTTAGTFGEYVNAELVTPVTSAALVRMGPYEVKADGLGASDPLDIQKGAQHGVDIQCVDGNGNGIDITSATVTAKVYNSGGSLVDTYACTATYAADGRATFTIDTTVTNTPGTYTATITRTTGANDTQVFGPLRIYVRDI